MVSSAQQLVKQSVPCLSGPWLPCLSGLSGTVEPTVRNANEANHREMSNVHDFLEQYIAGTPRASASATVSLHATASMPLECAAGALSWVMTAIPGTRSGAWWLRSNVPRAAACAESCVAQRVGAEDRASPEAQRHKDVTVQPHEGGAE